MADNTVIFVCGRKGSGKSTLVGNIIKEHDRVLIIDTLGEYGGNVKAEVVWELEPCVKALLAASRKKRFRIACRSERVTDLLALLEIAYEIPGLLLVVEETSYFCSPTQLPDEISKLVRYGRHREIDQIYIARRPSEIHRDLTAQADLIVSFVQHEPRDVDYLSRAAGIDCSSVRGLKPYKVQVWGNLSKAPLSVLEQRQQSAQTKLPLDNEGASEGDSSSS